MIPAVLFWDETWVLQAFALAFAGAYVWLYRKIVRFGVPRALTVGGALGKSASRNPLKRPGETL